MGLTMSLAETCWWTFVRTVLICLIAWPVCVAIERWLRRLPDGRRTLAFIILLAPFLFPELLVGYAFRSFALPSARRAEWLCAILLFLRVVPVGVVTLLASPGALIDSAAIHCRWLFIQANPQMLNHWKHLAACYWSGPIRRALPALGLIGLVAFQEFELAALLQSASWTDWFITAQRTGLDPTEMLQKAVWPILLQLPLLMGASFWLNRKKDHDSGRTELTPKFVSPWIKTFAVTYLGLALLGGCLVPLGVVAWNVPSGLQLLVRQPVQWTGLGREILIASAISLCAGITTWFAGLAWTDGPRTVSCWSLSRQGLLLPGLIGSLLLGLFAVGLFQQPWLRRFYDTPIPWFSVLIVWLLPRAVLLRFWLNSLTRTEAVHLAEMLSNPIHRSASYRHARHNIRSGELLFRLRDQPRLLGMGLLCYWAYLDLSSAYLLAPSGMSSGLVRLYNFMHFGRSAALSAESLVFFGTPLLAVLAIVQVLRRTGCH
jgi:hypothetical protein